MILDDAKEFLSTEKWYTDRGEFSVMTSHSEVIFLMLNMQGIPYRRGYLLVSEETCRLHPGLWANAHSSMVFRDQAKPV